MSYVVRVRLDDLFTEQDYVRKNNVKKFMTLIRRSMDIPEVVLKRCNVVGNFYVNDGNHRIQAYRRLGVKEMDFKYEPCSQTNCIEDCCSALSISVVDVRYK